MSTKIVNSQTLKGLDHLASVIQILTDKLGVKKWDLGASSSNDISVQVDKGNAKQLKASQKTQITLRVWNSDGLVGITSTSDISDEGLYRAVSGAQNASEFGNPNDIPEFSCRANEPLPLIERPVKEPHGINKLLELLKKAESNLINQHKAIKTVPYNGLSESSYNRLYLNSNGINRYLTRSQSSIYLYARAEELNRKPRSSGSVRLALGTGQLDIDGCINEAAHKTIKHLNYKPIDTGKYLVCFTPEAFLELISAFSNLFNARSVIDGVSLSTKDSLGKQIAVPFLSINDNALHPANISASSFDGEGTPTSNLSLIDGGILKNFLHSEATARHFGVLPTGHAGMGSKVSVGPDWFVISKTMGINSIDNSLNHKKYSQKFVLIEGLNALHAGVKSTQGSFSLPFDGWLIEKGEAISIEAATVAGDIKQVLKRIVQIEDEIVDTHIGVSPHIWVEELSITGEA